MNARRTIWLALILPCFCSLLHAQIPPLTYVDQALPLIEAGVEFHVFLRANGGAPPYVWSVASGQLPDGINLTPEGLLEGRPATPGAFELTIRVEDSARPARVLNQDFKITVAVSLLLEWLQVPKVNDNRIDGSVQVSNGTSETFDLTVVIVAVAENGRATAIGYEHFPLKPGANDVPIAFGSTLPYGAYVVHADAIAEIEAKRAILRQRLQTPHALQVAQGP